MIAASDGYLESVTKLLELGANTEFETEKGLTAQDIAKSNAPKHGDYQKVKGRLVYPMLESSYKQVVELLKGVRQQ